MDKTFYITTPIYYPSDYLHIGHAYCTVAVDAIARYKRQRGYDVFFLTGTDEHGQKIERKAKTKGVTPKEYVDAIVATIHDLWNKLDISNDGFIRTTDERHQKLVQKIFTKLYEQGDIYKANYTGLYCTPCEAFWTERQAVDGKCPDCGGPVETVEEESYFFRMSKYAPRLIQYINDHPDFIQPPERANEMLNNFLLPGLEDLCVSRTTFSWGIPVEFDPRHVVYVWIDALSNYITAMGYGTDDDALFKKYWPADIHVIGKEIVRFHTIYWPIILMALDLPLPKQIFGHGWLILDGGKMSKSKGNVVDPFKLIERYGADAIRYFLLREVSFGQDGLFSNTALLTRINADLANDLGNLLSRTVAMIEKYFDGRVPVVAALEEEDNALRTHALSLPDKVDKAMGELKMSIALGEIWKFIGMCNKYIDVTMPWVLAKNPETLPRLGTVLYNLAESLRFVGTLIKPFMTQTAPKLFEQLGIQEGQLTTWDSLGTFGLTTPGTLVKKGEALFPRIDIKKELAELEGIIGVTDKAKEKEPVAAEPVKKPKKEPDSAQKTPEAQEKPEEITIDDFAKLDLRLGRVTACETIEGADKLLKLTVKIGDEERTICSGIRQWYNPDDIVGKNVVVVYNLKPRKMRGIISHGMILCASDEGEKNLTLITSLASFQDGARIN